MCSVANSMLVQLKKHKHVIHYTFPQLKPNNFLKLTPLTKPQNLPKMSNSFYSYLAFIPPTSDADIKVLKKYLDSFYTHSGIVKKPSISLKDNKITVTFDDDYKFFISLSGKEHVIEEAIEFAESGGLDWTDKPFNIEKLITCNKRFEIWAQEDYDMDYFNDSLYIIEQIEKFKDVIIFYLN